VKIVVCIAPRAGDCYGHLTRYGEQLKAAAALRDIEVELLRFGEPDFLSRLFASLADESCIVHLYGFLYDLHISTSLAPDMPIHVLDNARAAIVATVGDHPFAAFMREMIRGAHPKTRFIVMDRVFPEEMQTLNPALRSSHYDYQPVAPPTNYDGALQADFQDRAWDLFIPMWLADLTGRDATSLLAGIHQDWLRGVVSATYEIVAQDTSRAPFHIFLEQLQQQVGNITLDDIREHNPKSHDAIMKIMAALDAIVRQERRQKIIASLLASVGNLRVAIASDRISSINVDENVQFIGVRPINDIVTLMANARAILNTNPTYPSALHERVICGMMYESCVITDVNQYISDTFEGEDFIPYSHNDCLTIADIYSEFDVRKVAAAGASKIRNNPAHSWDAHIDGLIRAATA
jgi:hypothetical protein